jgi:hypothetical protein
VKLAHLADPHLGFRQHHRLTPQGINQREADVGAAFRAAVDGVIAARPDAVIIAGDLFHAVRPTNTAIVFAFRQLQRLVDALPDAPVVLIAGNHDTPRSSETGSILGLFADIGVHVATTQARRWSFLDGALSVLAVPHAALVEEKPLLRPEGNARHQVLVLHGEAQGVLSPEASALEYGGLVIRPEDARPDLWTYTAWGHYHVQRQVAPRAWYAGSLEYVSTNIWGELHEQQALGVAGKGWLLVDLDTGLVTPQPIVPPRRVLDLPPVDGHDLDAATLDGMLAARVAAAPGGIADAVVRVVMRGVPRHVARQLDHAKIRQWKADALHFHLDVRRPDAAPRTASGAAGRRRTLPDVVAEFLAQRPLPADLPRERFVSLGTALLAAAEAEARDA